MTGQELTHVSDEALRHITCGHMSPGDAAMYLSRKPTISRGVGETLRLMCGEAHPQEALQQFFLELDPSLDPRSVAKSVQNWLRDRNVPSRENLYRMAFALSLSESQLDYLLSLADGCGIQYRDVREMSLAWFLREGLAYSDAVAFCDSLPRYERHEVSSSEHTHLTLKIANESRSARTIDELRAVCERYSSSFGTHHLRAHYYFDRYLDKLIRPETWSSDAPGKDPGAQLASGDGNKHDVGLLPEEREYSLETVVEEYLALSMPAGRRRDRLVPVQKLMKANWPNLTAIKDIRNHKKDVPRKLLLLLYVVTENIGFDDDGDGYVWDGTLEERVRDHMVIINAIMDDCGMARLDMRNAFDWLVMYSVAAGEDEAMSERMEAVIAEMFVGMP